ncbi:MAG: Iron-sulfur cluster assembly protein SufD, partial [uncultured Corynebacteriales bacterium]
HARPGDRGAAGRVHRRRPLARPRRPAADRAVHLPEPGRVRRADRPGGGVAVHPAGPDAGAAGAVRRQLPAGRRDLRARPGRDPRGRRGRRADRLSARAGRPGQRAGDAPGPPGARRHRAQGHHARRPGDDHPARRRRDGVRAPVRRRAAVRRGGRGPGPRRLRDAGRERRDAGRRRRVADAGQRAGLGGRRGARGRARRGARPGLPAQARGGHLRRRPGPGQPHGPLHRARRRRRAARAVLRRRRPAPGGPAVRRPRGAALPVPGDVQGRAAGPGRAHGVDRRRADPGHRRADRHLRAQPQPAAHRRRPRRLGPQPGDRDRRGGRGRARQRDRAVRRPAAVLPDGPGHPGDRGAPVGGPRLLRRRDQPARGARGGRPAHRGGGGRAGGGGRV